MKKADMNKFAQLISTIAELHDKSISKALVEIYWECLQKFELLDIKHAIKAHAKNPDTGQFMPKPSDVVRYLEGGTNAQALQAWTKVEKAIESIGGYSSVIFDDALIHAVISDMGGWIQFCKMTEEESPFKAQEFEKRYARYAIRAPEKYPRKLMGIFELQNSAAAYLVPSPILIGNRQKAENVFKNGSTKMLEYHEFNASIEKILPALNQIEKGE
jgi:hypothetical protein